MVRHIRPKTLADALAFLADDPFCLMAGGTDVMVQKRSMAGVEPDYGRDVLYIRDLSELKGIHHDGSSVRIGAAEPLENILGDPYVPKLLRMAVADIASPAIRHMATIGGNIGNASPAGDTLVALHVLDACVVLASQSGKRSLPIRNVITGVRKTAIRDDELIEAVVVPSVPYTSVSWTKVGTRRANALSKVAFAGLVLLEGDVIKDFRMAFGAVSPTIVRDRTIEKTVIGHKVSDLTTILKKTLEAYDRVISPIDDQRSDAAYRRQAAMNLARDFIEQID